MMEGTAFDNFNPMVWRFGANDINDGMYMAVTDAPGGLRFNISDLSTMGKNSAYQLLFNSIRMYILSDSYNH